MRLTTQIEPQRTDAGQKPERMSMSRMSTSELAKNWPSSVFGPLNNESTNVENPLHLQGVFGDLAQPGWARQPKHYESPALTAELWARNPRHPIRVCCACPHAA